MCVVSEGNDGDRCRVSSPIPFHFRLDSLEHKVEKGTGKSSVAPWAWGKKGQAGFANFQLTPTVIMKDFLSRGSQEKCYLSNASVHIETPFKHQPRFVVVVAAKIAELVSCWTT